MKVLESPGLFWDAVWPWKCGPTSLKSLLSSDQEAGSWDIFLPAPLAELVEPKGHRGPSALCFR